MSDILIDALVDTLKALPFLFAAYLVIEFVEHRASDRLTGALAKMGRFGPVGGSLLGCVPQCGFSVAAANFYAGRLITFGTLAAVFIATSDEALPILLSHPEAYADMAKLLAVKFVAGALFGVIFDLLHRRAKDDDRPFDDLCADCGCDEHGILRAAIHHTVQIALFLLIINVALGFAIYFIGEDNIARVMLSGSVFQPLLTALIGFVPNCAASVIMTELYLSGSLSFGAAVAGLCTGAGLGLAVLFRVNKRPKENLLMMAALYVAAVATGLLCGLIF